MSVQAQNEMDIEEGPDYLDESHKSLKEPEENISAKHPGWVDALPQIGYACLSLMVGLQTGMSTGFSGVFLPQLMSDPHFKKFDVAEASWTASLLVLSGPLGGLTIGPIMDRFGRKKAIILANIPAIISWALMYSVNESLWPLYLARIISGSGGGMMAAVNVYISEICHPNYRGMLMCVIGVFVSAGIVIITFLAYFMEWHTAAKVMLVSAIFSFLSSFLLPESPSWLVTFAPNPKRLKKAEQQLEKLYKTPWLLDFEKEKIMKVYRQSDRGLSSTQSMIQNTCCYEFKKLHVFTDRTIYYPLLMLVIIFLFQELSGIFIVIYYSRNLFLGLGSNFGMGLDEYTASVLVSLIRLVMSIIMSYLSMHVGRRVLLLVSSVGMASSIFIAGILDSGHTMVFTKDIGGPPSQDPGVLGLVTVLCVLFFVLFATVGMLSIPWALLCELLPTRARGIGNGVIMSFAFLGMFLILKGVPFLLEIISLSCLFFIFAAVCLTAAVFTYFYIPETFRKDFSEIEMLFKNKSPVKK